MQKSSDPPALSKVCSKCGLELPATLDFFYKRRYGLYGLYSWCKKCHIRITQPNHMKWQRENRDRVNARERERRKDPIVAARQNEQHRKSRKQFPERYKAIRDKYRVKHPEVDRVRNHNYLSRKRNAEGKFTAKEIENLYLEQRGKCAYCECELNGVYHADHFIPLSKGGSNWISNIRLACALCNTEKHNKMPWEWIGRLL